MKKLRCIAILCCAVAIAGCQDSHSTPGESPLTVDSTSHTHTDHDSSHHSAEGHAHGEGPHGGTIADWGGGTYHVEFLVDHDEQQATAYVLGSDEKTPTPIGPKSIELSLQAPSVQVELIAVPQDDDPEGKSSRFVGTHEQLSIVQEYSGTLTGVIDGTPYSGNFAE
ncbi:MAG: hypothetical protein AAFU85_10090 [Planctomycetota bacterium]